MRLNFLNLRRLSKYNVRLGIHSSLVIHDCFYKDLATSDQSIWSCEWCACIFRSNGKGLSVASYFVFSGLLCFLSVPGAVLSAWSLGENGTRHGNNTIFYLNQIRCLSYFWALHMFTVRLTNDNFWIFDCLSQVCVLFAFFATAQKVPYCFGYGLFHNYRVFFTKRDLSFK